MSEIIYPKNETVWHSHYGIDHKLAYVITSKKDNREWYYYYKVIDGNLQKMGKSRTPLELIDKFARDMNVPSK